MAKMTLLAAAVLAIALLAMMGVSGFRATITTTINEDDQWGPGQQSQQRCRQQVQQQQQQLRQCQQFLQQQSQQGSPYDLSVYNQQQQQQQVKQQCCQQLRNFEEQCRCEAVKHIVERVLQQIGQGQQFGQVQQILQTARYLPRVCNLQPQQCQLQQGWPY